MNETGASKNMWINMKKWFFRKQNGMWYFIFNRGRRHLIYKKIGCQNCITPMPDRYIGMK